MDETERRCELIRQRIFDSAPDIRDRIKWSAARRIAEQLLDELNEIPSNCGKLIYEQVKEVPVIRRAA